MLVYDNHQAYRLGRRLPIGGETAEVIRRQQQRVRDRFPTTAQARLKLLPRARTNPEGTKPLNDISTAHRKWVDSLPDLVVPLITTEAGTQVTSLVPFDRARNGQPAATVKIAVRSPEHGDRHPAWKRILSSLTSCD